MFIRAQLGCEANAYIRLSLSVEGSLWRHLAEQPLESGEVSSYLPPTADQKTDLPFFEWHLHSRRDLENSQVDYEYRSEERKQLFSYLKETQSGLLIFHGETIPPNGQIPNIDGPVTTYFRTLRYPDSNGKTAKVTETFLIMRSDVTMSEFELGLEYVLGRRPFLCAFTSLPETEERYLPTDKQLTPALLAAFAERTRYIMVGAYGGDANVIWEREK